LGPDLFMTRLHRPTLNIPLDNLWHVVKLRINIGEISLGFFFFVIYCFIP
jgi:hypothetical protein